MPEHAYPVPPPRKRLPHRAVPIYFSILFLLVHILAPWGLSRLSARRGWSGRRPGTWNLAALALVGAGIASTMRLILMHYRSSPDTFLELRQGRKLLTQAPYAFSRNPMYLSEMAFWFGWALFYGSIPVFAGFLFWVLAFNFLIVPYEERDLQARFGDAYRQYRQAVPRWFRLPGA